MPGFKKLKIMAVFSLALGILIFSAAFAYAAENNEVGTSQTQSQNMEQMSEDEHNKGISQNKMEMDMSKEDHSEEKTGEAQSQAKQEEPIPWGAIYGFLIINGAVIIIAAMIKLTKGQKTQEGRL